MRELDLAARPRRRRKATTRPDAGRWRAPDLVRSVGSYDNALMENFFSILKIELVYRRSWRSRDEAENAISPTYGWYNNQRIQKPWLAVSRRVRSRLACPSSHASQVSYPLA